MQQIEIYIDGRKVFLPAGFSTRIENTSPLLDLDTLITGGYSFDIRLPFGDNRIVFQHAERLEVVQSKAAYSC